MITSEGRKQVADLFKNIREKYEQNPFDIYYSLVYIPEYLLLLCYPDEKRLALVNDLGHEIKKNELIGMDDSSLAGLKIAAAVDQENRNFSLYFAYTLRQMPTMKVVEFLDHQMMLFKGNFKSFLEGVLIEYDDEGMNDFKMGVRLLFRAGYHLNKN